MDAIIVGEDHIAMGIIQDLARRGIKVPGDIALVGLNGIPLVRKKLSALTTANTSFSQMGLLAINGLIKLIENEIGTTGRYCRAWFLWRK